MFGFLKKAVSDQFIARPSAEVPSLIFRWPDQSIPRGAKLTVRADESVLFFKQGVLAGHLGPGTYSLDTTNLPFLGDIFVSPLTGDNHFLTELFFVHNTETPYYLGPAPLGSFQDIGTRLLVKVLYAANFSVRVTDPVRLVSRLIGLRSDGATALGGLLDARVKSMLSEAVGRLLASEPVLQVVSNQYSEQLGQAVIERTRAEFTGDGVELTRFLSLELKLDEASETELRAFGGRMADLSVQREQADVASQPGFAAYNLVKGQVDLMRGVAAGAATHGLPITGGGLGGIGIGGAALMGASVPSASRDQYMPATAPAPRLAGGGGAKYYLRGPGGVEGPYPPRQVALRAVSLRLGAESVFVRQPGQNEWVTALDVPEIASEIERRSATAAHAAGAPAASVRSGPTPSEAFENALRVAALDKVITPDELALLIALACGAGLATGDAAASEYVLTRAVALGCTAAHALPPAEAPSSGATFAGGPPPLVMARAYVYSNGIDTVQGLSAEAVATRVRAAPDGVHMVWWTGAPDWVPASRVEAIAALAHG